MAAETNKDRSSRESIFQRDSPVRIFTITLLLPLLIWSTAFLVMGSGVFRLREFALLPTYGIFVAQTALVSWCVGRYLNHAILRIAVFLWCIAFIDVMFILLRFTLYVELSTVGYAFASAQLGLLIAWAVLATQRLVLRVCSSLIGVTAVMMYVSAFTSGFGASAYGRNDWDTILTWQAIATLVLCGVLRWRGFKILPIDASTNAPADEAAEDDDAKSEPVQFSIMHLLLWTLGLAPIFAVARLVDWSAFEFATGLRLAQFVSMAVLLSLTSLVAIWSGLGTGNAILRIVVALGFSAASGAILAYACNQQWLLMLYFELYQFGTESYVFWISWTVLAGFFYIAMLMVLRATQHRLMRIK